MANERSTATLLQLLDAAYQRRTGRTLGAELCPEIAQSEGVETCHAWIHQRAPFGLLAHNGQDDPRFIYANASALRIFEYSREEFMRLPSRLSAADEQQPERQRILDEVRTRGIAYGYAGIRIARSGRLFQVHDGVIWEVEDEHGERLGQAALIRASPS